MLFEMTLKRVFIVYFFPRKKNLIIRIICFVGGSIDGWINITFRFSEEKVLDLGKVPITSTRLVHSSLRTVSR